MTILGYVLACIGFGLWLGERRNTKRVRAAFVKSSTRAAELLDQADKMMVTQQAIIVGLQEPQSITEHAARVITRH